MIQILIGILLLGSVASGELTPVQQQSLQLILEWIHDPTLGQGRMPSVSDFRKPVLPMTYLQLVGSGIYRNHPKAIFNSPEDFWLALSAFAREQGQPISLLSAWLYRPSEKMLEVLRRDALEDVFKWIQRHEHFPMRPDFGNGPDQIPINFLRLTSEGRYARTAKKGAKGLFSSPSEFWQQLTRYVALQGTVDIPLKPIFNHPELDEVKCPQEANERVLAWVKNHPGKAPLRRDFGPDPGQICLRYTRLMAQQDYAPEGPKASQALFPGVQESWCQFKHFAAEQGVNFPLLKVQFHDKLLPATRALLQQEALELVSNWISQHNRLPHRLDYGFKEGQIPVDYRRLTALDSYAANEPHHRLAIFSSQDEFRQKLIAFENEKMNSSCTSLF